jgi:hypothetical protein
VTTIETAITKAITTTIEPHVAHIRSGPGRASWGRFFLSVLCPRSHRLPPQSGL